MPYQIMTDSASDLPYALLDERDIKVVNIPCSLDGKAVSSDLRLNQQENTFYPAMRSGAVAQTAAVNVADYLEIFTPIIAEKDILFISFSSAMTSSFGNMVTAREMLLKEHPGRQFIIVDTLTVTMGVGLLVLDACDARDNGKAIEEAAKIARDQVMRMNVAFTVEDLVYLRRGGRITGATAIVGAVLNIKPILVVNRGGLVISVEKARGRRQAIRALVWRFGQIVAENMPKRISIVDADAPEEAQVLKTMLEEQFDMPEIIMAKMGPIIGTHAGPGTLAICAVGAERNVP